MSIRVGTSSTCLDRQNVAAPWMKCLHVWVYFGPSTSPGSFGTIQQILFGDDHLRHLTPGLPPCQHHQHSKLPQRDCILEAVFMRPAM